MFICREIEKSQWAKPVLQVLGLVLYFVIGCAFYGSYEGWSINTTCFFTVVTMCTVGYGYHTPSSDSSRLFTIFYIVIGVYFGFTALVDTVKSQLDSVSAYVQRISGDGTIEHRYLHHQRVFWACLSCIVAFIFIGGGVVSSLEGWSFITGLYFAVETSSTVGFGDLDLNENQTKAFVAFYIIVSTTLIVILVKNYETIRKIKREILKRQVMMLKRRDLHTVAELDNGDGISEAQFVLAILERIGVLDHRNDISPWIEKFRSMQLNNRGNAERKAIDSFAATEAELALQELDKISHNSGIFAEESNPMSLSMQGISLLEKDKEDHIDF